jgi:hypothetical protein
MASGDPWTTELHYYSSPIVPFNAINLAEAIDYVYLNDVTPCGFLRYDQNCDEVLDALDVEWLIEYLFAGGSWGCR